MPRYHDRRLGAVQGAKEPRPKGGRQIAGFGRRVPDSGVFAPVRAPDAPKRAICRPQLAAIYGPMT